MAFSNYWSDRRFMGTFVNLVFPSLHGKSLKITLTVPLINDKYIIISNYNLDYKSLPYKILIFRKGKI